MVVVLDVDEVAVVDVLVDVRVVTDVVEVVAHFAPPLLQSLVCLPRCLPTSVSQVPPSSLAPATSMDNLASRQTLPLANDHPRSCD